MKSFIVSFDGKRLVGVKMLVSSIGYFEHSKTIIPDNVIKNQNTKINLSEGFGHYNQYNKLQKCDSGFMKAFVDSFKSLLEKSKSDETSKYLSLIA